MVSADSDSEDRPDASHEPRECMACRGSGRVISNLGGTPKDVACPWCEGKGMRVPGVDAQAPWRSAAEGGESAEDSPTPAGDAAEDPVASEDPASPSGS